ncbi:MAG: protein phosphatase 2C domain-containing protein [Anaerolineales bacterium]|jgi:protein phosphatase
MIPVENAHLRIAAATDPGMKGKNNEDQYSVTAFKLPGTPPKSVLFAIVADGIGGHRAGEVAADIAVEIISDKVAFSDGSQPVETMQTAILQASQAINTQGNQKADQIGMGTTVVCVWIEDEKLYAAHVGNSRLYLLRAKKLYQLNIDHTWVKEAVDAGALTPEQARSHPHANIIRRYLGSPTPPDVDLRMRTDRSSIYSEANQGFRLRPGDRLLLCSDGLNDMVADQRIAEELKIEDLHESAAELINAANLRGGKDNITVILLEVPRNTGLRGYWDMLAEIPPQLAFAYAGIAMMGLAIIYALALLLAQLMSK